MKTPRGVFISGNKLIVADTGQNRVFIWNQIPKTPYQKADVVLGQLLTTDTGRNSGDSVHANTLMYPSGIWTDGHKLAVADAWNHRVLVWHTFPSSYGQAADVVIGQKDFFSNQPNIFGIGHTPTAQSLNWPYGVFSDGHRLYIADTGNRRVLVFNEFPTENFKAADAVIGKPNFEERDYENTDAIWPYSIKLSNQGHVAITQGDNLHALKALLPRYAGKVKCIYIDPPYNTGNRDWVYNDRYVGANDRWRHSQWLEFLYRRLTLARDLLTPDGVIMVSINDENRARLELLMDEVMPGRRLGSITWRTRQGSNADQQCFLSVDHEHVLVYGNPGFAFNGFAKSYEAYGNPDQNPRGDWMSSDLTLGYSWRERPNLYFPLFDAKTGIAYPPNPDRVWVYASEAA